jgi:hypothetical protein
MLTVRTLARMSMSLRQPKTLQRPLKFLVLILSANWAGKGQFIKAIVLVIQDDVPGHFRMLA